MKIDDIVTAAGKHGARIARWVRFIATVEATLDDDGNILRENDGDGAGMTFCGLTQRDDNLPEDPSADWVADTYKANYWDRARASELPMGTGEEVANIAVNEGVSTAARILQESISDLGLAINIDSNIGPETIELAFRLPDQELCLAISAHNDQHYAAIAKTNHEYRFLRGWLNRDRLMVETFA